jgi:hypothetical protein
MSPTTFARNLDLDPRLHHVDAAALRRSRSGERGRASDGHRRQGEDRAGRGRRGRGRAAAQAQGPDAAGHPAAAGVDPRRRPARGDVDHVARCSELLGPHDGGAEADHRGPDRVPEQLLQPLHLRARGVDPAHGEHGLQGLLGRRRAGRAVPGSRDGRHAGGARAGPAARHRAQQLAGGEGRRPVAGPAHLRPAGHPRLRDRRAPRAPATTGSATGSTC